MVRLTRLKETPESLGERHEVIVMRGSARLADRPRRRLRRRLLGRNEPRRLSDPIEGLAVASLEEADRDVCVLREPSGNRGLQLRLTVDDAYTTEDLRGDLCHHPSGASRPYPAAPAVGFVSAGSSHRACAGVAKDKGHGIRAR